MSYFQPYGDFNQQAPQAYSQVPQGYPQGYPQTQANMDLARFQQMTQPAETDIPEGTFQGRIVDCDPSHQESGRFEGQRRVKVLFSIDVNGQSRMSSAVFFPDPNGIPEKCDKLFQAVGLYSGDGKPYYQDWFALKGKSVEVSVYYRKNSDYPEFRFYPPQAQYAAPGKASQEIQPLQFGANGVGAYSQIQSAPAMQQIPQPTPQTPQATPQSTSQSPNAQAPAQGSAPSYPPQGNRQAEAFSTQSTDLPFDID